MLKIPLSKAADYSSKRVSAKDISVEDFISTDNMLQNKAGITKANYEPMGVMPAYCWGNILVGNIRPYLKKIWFANKDGGCSADVLVFQIRKGFDPKFIYYALLRDDFFAHMMQGSKGTKMPRGDKKQILDFLIPDFDLRAQKKVASVLSSLDAKIEINNRINAELEAMAKTLYDYWFVQFNFPDANGKPYKSSGSKMVYNSDLKREIPEGWDAGLISEWIRSGKNGDWGKESIEGNYTEKVYCIRGADINDLNGAGICTPPIRFILEKNTHKYLEAGDLIVEISGGSPTQSTGRMAYLSEESLDRFDAPIICSNFCKAVSLKDKKSIYYFAFLWQSLYQNGIFFGYEGKTSGIKNFLFDSFTNSYFSIIPEGKVVEKFYYFMKPIQAKKQKALKENQQLTELRDWLLPMLMNGQVTVGETAENWAMAAEPEAAYGSD